jgi:hypothetical protein
MGGGGAGTGEHPDYHHIHSFKKNPAEDFLNAYLLSI